MDQISADIPNLAADLLARVLAKGTVPVTLHEIQYWLETYAQITASQPVTLSGVKPNFEALKMQLQSALSKRDSWKELLQAGTGETILEFIATVGAYSQMSIQRSQQETSLQTARLASSIYSMTRDLGVHINRKAPAWVTVRLISDLNYALIPSYSQFTVGGKPFFNREAIVFTSAALTNDVVLYEGEVVIEQLTSTGLPFQRFEVGNADFNISDTDIFVVNDKTVVYTRITDGLWHYPGQQTVFFENTTPNGNVELRFGNGLYGRTPELNEQLNVVYCRTTGSEANTTRVGLRVDLQELNDTVPERLRTADGSDAEKLRGDIVGAVSGVTLDAVSNGDDERDKEFYRILAPRLYAAKDRGVTRNDYHAVALTYPGLADIYFQGQKQLAPMNRNFINVIGVTPLLATGEPMSNDQFDKFYAWMLERGIWYLEAIHLPPTPIDIDIKAKVFCPSGTDLPKVRNYLEYQIQEKFGIRRGSLGYSVYLNDLHSLLKTQRFSVQVDYVDLDLPVVDCIITRRDYVRIRSIQLDVAYSTRQYESYKPHTVSESNVAVSGSRLL